MTAPSRARVAVEGQPPDARPGQRRHLRRGDRRDHHTAGAEEHRRSLPIAFYAVVSVAVIGLYLAFLIPIYLRWRMGDAFEAGSWTNGAEVQVDEPDRRRRDRHHQRLLHLAVHPRRRAVQRRLRLVERQLRAGADHRHARSCWRSGGRCRRRTGSPGRSTPSTRRSSRPSRTDIELDQLLDQVPVLAGPRSVADLPGGLTNRNLRVTTSTGDYVVRLSAERRRPARHRPGRGARELPGGGGGRRRRAGRRLPARPRHAGDHLPAGHVADQRDHRRSRRPRPVADAIRRLQAGPRFVDDFDMFARQAGYLALVRERGFPLPERVRRLRAAVGASTPRPRRTPRAHGPVQQRPARRQLHRRRRPGLADRLRVLRQQRPGLRARQHRDRVRPDRGAGRRAGGRRGSGATPTRSSGPGSTCRRCARSTAGRSGASSSPPPARSTSTSTGGAWSGSRRPPAVHQRRLRGAARRGGLVSSVVEASRGDVSRPPTAPGW